MKTPMNIYNTAMKKKKNRKGFSLVELIVVLVIMAILAAALVLTLIGYIKQTRQSNSKNEAAMAVSAAQTIASSAYASGDGKYVAKELSNQVIQVYPVSSGSVAVNATGTDGDDFTTAVESLSEVDDAGGNVTAIAVTDGVVTSLTYVAKNGDQVTYSKTSGYTVGG